METWKDRNIVITGGSSGLGFHLARAWCQKGARVLLVARDHERLQHAAEQLQTEKGSVLVYAADVTQSEQVDRLADWVATEFSPLHVLVNAAGKSDRGRVCQTPIAQFDALWQLNFLATVRCTQALMPHLEQTGGSVINIGSLAAKTAAPFLGAYAATKFPVAAFSQQLRLELAADRAARDSPTLPPVHVMLVCPGPIARHDAGQRYDDQSVDLPESARQPGGGARVRALDPVVLSQEILRACQQRKLELVRPAKSKILFALQALAPAWGDRLLQSMTRRE